MIDGREIHHRIEPQLRAEWGWLARQTKSSPFLWPEWISAWWDAFGQGELRIFAVYQDGSPVGVLPLQLLGGVLSSFENLEVPFTGFLVKSETAARQLLGALFSQGAPRIDLNFPDYSFVGNREVLISLIREAAEAAGYEVLTRLAQKVPYVDLSKTSLEAYESGLRRNFRRNLHRCRRRLEEEGRLTLEVFDGKERLEELLEEGFRIEGSGWKDAKGTSINSSVAKRRFYTEAAQWAAERDWLRLYFLRLDRRVLAFDYCLEHNEILYMIKGGYDPTYKKFSPSMVQLHLILARAFSEGLSTCDLGSGFTPWKREWTTAYYELISLSIFAREGWEQDSWYYQIHLAAQEIAELIPSAEAFILVDEDNWWIDTGGGRRAIPFPETWDGLYGGPPEDDEEAIEELERQRQGGATYMVFGWPAFWWLEYYEGLQRYLRSRFRCLAENERIVVFDLRE